MIQEVASGGFRYDSSKRLGEMMIKVNREEEMVKQHNNIILEEIPIDFNKVEINHFRCCR